MLDLGEWVKIAGGFWGLIAAVWLLGSQSTAVRHLRVNHIRQTWRRLRARSFTAILNLLAWPHIVDIFLKTKHAAVGVTPSEVVWTSSTNATLRRYAGKRRGTPILVVHSVITEPWILDLAENHSLIGHLVGEGHDVFLLDWGAPKRRDGGHGLAKYVEVLQAAERVVMSITKRRKLDLLGYCLGGTICLVRAAAVPSPHVRSIVAMAPPIDLAAGGRLASFLRHPLMRPAQLLDADSCVPAAVVRETFHALRPQALKSVRLGLRLRRDPSAMAYYGAMARWAWEQRRLSGAMFFDLVDLFRSNSLLSGSLRVGDLPIDLHHVACPTLLLVAARDHIAPSETSIALETGGEVETVTVPSGHVSMIVDTGARNDAWPALSRWFKSRHTGKRQPRPSGADARATALEDTPVL